MCQALPAFHSQSLDFQLCSLYFCARQSFSNRCVWGTLLTCLSRHRPVFCLHLIGQMHSLSFCLFARCPRLEETALADMGILALLAGDA